MMTRRQTPIRMLASGILSAALSVSMAAPGFAAEISPFGNRDMDAPVDLAASYRLPAALASKLQVRQNGETLEGTFTAINGEESALGGLRYHLELWGTGKLDGMLFARETSAEPFALAGGETQEMTFAMQAPQLPAGDYTFRIQMMTEKGRSLGWADAPLTLQAGAAPFAYAAPAAVLLPEFANQAVDPMAGPNVSPDGMVILRAAVENKGATPLSLIPTLRMSQFDATRGSFGETSYPVVTVQPGEMKMVEVPVKAGARAEVYSGLLSFVDATTKAPVSSLSEFRWVVRGADADTLPVRTRSMGTKQGEQAVFEIAYVGAPDAETVTKAIPTLQLTDDLGVAAELTLPQTELTDAIRSGVATLTLTRNLVGTPAVHMTIRDLNGAILDEHSEAIAMDARPLAAFPVSSVLLVLMLLAAAGLAIQGIRMGRNMKIALPGTFAGGTAALMLLVQMGPAMAAGNGNGIEVVTPNAGNTWHGHSAPAVVALFVSAPQHNAAAGSYAKHNVPLQYKVTFGVCENRISHVKVIGRFDANGGKQTTLEGSNANWQTVHTADYQAGPTCDGGYNSQSPQGIEACLFDRTFNGTVNLSGLASNACSTTLQLIAKLGQSGLDVNANQPGPPNAAVDRSDVTFRSGQVHAVNLWLDFCTQQQKPQCSDQQDNDGDGVVDAHDIGCYQNGQYNPNDNDESNPAASSSSSSSMPTTPLPQCSDNVDNDWDGRRDMADPGCYTNGQYNPNDNDETDPLISSSSSSSLMPQQPACSDGRDNDYDGRIDYNDPGCYNNGQYTPNDNDEWDPGMSSSSSSYSQPHPQCSDGADNDHDWKTDQQDPGCYTNGYYNPNDNDENDGWMSSSSSSSFHHYPSSSSSQYGCGWWGCGCGSGGCGGWNTNVNGSANTTVNNQVNAGAQNNTQVTQLGGGWQMTTANPTATTTVNNQVNAASQNVYEPWNPWSMGVSNLHANTTVNNSVNAGSQNNTQVYQQQQAGQSWGGWQASTVTPTANTTVNASVNAGSQNTVNGWWW